jgi:hypothetical protein
MFPRICPIPAAVLGFNVCVLNLLGQVYIDGRGALWTARAGALAMAIGLVGAAIAALLMKLGNLHLDLSKKFKAMELEHARALDVARREMLGPKLEASLDNQNLMRKTLHDIRNELQASKLENVELRDDLEEANRQVAEIGSRFVEAIEQIARLTASMERLRIGQPEAMKSAVREAITDSQHEIPVHKGPQPK